MAKSEGLSGHRDGSQSVVPGPAATVTQGNLSEMQTLSSTSDLLVRNSQAVVE